MKNVLAFVMLIATALPANAMSFNYDTTYWFKKIHMECRDSNWECHVWVDGEYHDAFPYKVEDNKAYLSNEEVDVTIDLKSGDFTWKGK